MKLKITAEWLLSFDDKTPEPSGYITQHESAEVARHRESAQAAPLQVPPTQEANKVGVRTAAAGK